MFHALQSRARFAGLTYLAVAGLVLSLLGGVVVTGGARGPEVSAPALDVATPVSPTPSLRQLQSDAPEPAAAIPTSPASPTPESTETPQPVFTPRYVRARPIPKPAAPSPAPAHTLTGAQVGITDAGIFPKMVSVMAGSTVTWVNMGTEVHTATAAQGSRTKLDSGGLAAGQRYSLALFDPGMYHYTSAPDCLANSNKSLFDCSGASIRVLAPIVPALSAPASATPGLFAPPTATVQITDSGFVPDHVVVKAGGWITWINQGSTVHTATGSTQQFDTGGLAPHQSSQMRFPNPGTVSYTSAPDCLNGNHAPSFACASSFSVTVSL